MPPRRCRRPPICRWPPCGRGQRGPLPARAGRMVAAASGRAGRRLAGPAGCKGEASAGLPRGHNRWAAGAPAVPRPHNCAHLCCLARRGPQEVLQVPLEQAILRGRALGAEPRQVQPLFYHLHNPATASPGQRSQRPERGRCGVFCSVGRRRRNAQLRACGARAPRRRRAGTFQPQVWPGDVQRGW